MSNSQHLNRIIYFSQEQYEPITTKAHVSSSINWKSITDTIKEKLLTIGSNAEYRLITIRNRFNHRFAVTEVDAAKQIYSQLNQRTTADLRYLTLEQSAFTARNAIVRCMKLWISSGFLHVSFWKATFRTSTMAAIIIPLLRPNILGLNTTVARRRWSDYSSH